MKLYCLYYRVNTRKMGLSSLIYNGFTKRTSTMVLGIVVRALVFERAFDAGADYLWETHNKGKLWKDIKGKYEVAQDEE